MKHTKLSLSSSLWSIFFVLMLLLFSSVNAAFSEKAEAPSVAMTAGSDQTNRVLDSQSLEELQAKLPEVENRIRVMAVRLQALKAELRDIRAAQHTNEQVQAVWRKIAELKKEIEDMIDEMPPVVDKRKQIDSTESELRKAMQERTQILAQIRLLEQQTSQDIEK